MVDGGEEEMDGAVVVVVSGYLRGKCGEGRLVVTLLAGGVREKGRSCFSCEGRRRKIV